MLEHWFTSITRNINLNLYTGYKIMGEQFFKTITSFTITKYVTNRLQQNINGTRQ